MFGFSLLLRGAELIEELRQKQIMEQMERENQILENIKFKMERIKASQMKVQGPSYHEPSSHFTGMFSPSTFYFEHYPSVCDYSETQLYRSSGD